MRPPLTKVSRFAQEFLDKMPPQLAELARQRWLKTANVKPVCKSDATREYKHHLHHLDRLSPPANRLPETAIDLTPFKTPHRRWPAPKRHDTAESVMAELDTLLARLETEHDALYIVH